ncbi:MAG: DUF6353 family protein [Bryobacteraceae bacterium]|jgi:hypothetical protein
MTETVNNQYSRRFDQANKHWSPQRDANRLFLQCQQNYCNDVLRAYGYLFLNDVQDMLGFDRTPQGQLVGWLRDGEGAGFVDFNITEVEEEPGVFILTLNPDGVMYDKI